MGTVVVVDAVNPLRDWLRATPTMVATIGVNWWAGKFPTDPYTTPSKAACRISRVGGGTLQPCLDQPQLQFTVIGGQSGSAVANAAADLQSFLESVPPGTVIRAAAGSDPALLFMGATVLSNLDLPDPSTGDPTRVLTVDITTLAT